MNKKQANELARTLAKKNASVYVSKSTAATLLDTSSWSLTDYAWEKVYRAYLGFVVENNTRPAIEVLYAEDYLLNNQQQKKEKADA